MGRNMNVASFIDCVVPALRTASFVANELQSKATNLKKPEATEKKRALTHTDLAVQEIVLAAILEFQGAIRLHCEEETKLVSQFKSTVSDWTVILDPIDGTLRYLNQDESFGIQAALVYRTEYVAAVIALPNHGILLAAENGSGAIEQRQGALVPVKVSQKSNLVFCHDSISLTQQSELLSMGFQLSMESGADITTSPVTGRAIAGLRPHKVSLFGRIGALITLEAGGICCSGSGVKLSNITTDPLDGLLVAASQELAQKLNCVFRQP